MKTRSVPLETRRPASPATIFPPRRDYTSLSIKDLLDARQAYHVYLSTLENVVATAVGRYLIHEDDWYATHPPDQLRPPDHPRIEQPRSIANSVVRPWSWPAVLVFVKEWRNLPSLGANAIPRTLLMPDGRVIPTCVVWAKPDESLPPPAPGPSQTSALLGGGYSCLREHQGQQTVGTFACLVRKGGSYYALTNRHVSGGDGEEVRAYVRGEYRRVGRTSSFAVDRQLFGATFPEWAQSNLYLTLDAGLVRIDDIGDWTSQAFGIGEIGDVFNATAPTITLDLIGCPLRAFGGTSGVIEGQIQALFFQYESVGGYDYVTDVLIGPRRDANGNRNPLTRPGDSGTLWFYDPPVSEASTEMLDFDHRQDRADMGRRARRLRPIAMQWGGQRVELPDGARGALALGAFLSTICRSLDVEVVRNWSTGHNEYWGKIGHFSIGWKACDLAGGKLGALMQANQERIGFGDETLRLGRAFKMGRDAYVPLADVPDYVWIRARGTRPFEGIQHFADIDIHDIDGRLALIEQCFRDPQKVSATVWQSYFEGFAAAGVGPDDGALPFRVWQIWEAMVGYLSKKTPDVQRFVAAAGILAHYVGDASQPLHCSFMHHGMPPMVKVKGRKYPVTRDSAEFAEFKKSKEAKIHAIYEEGMLEVDPATALVNVNQLLKARGRAAPAIQTGHDAAVATLRLMYQSQKRLKPKSIIDADDPGLSDTARGKALWANRTIRRATVASLADSSRLLATLWAAAWEAGRRSHRQVEARRIQGAGPRSDLPR